MKITLPSIFDDAGVPIRGRIQSLRRLISYLGPGFFVTIGFIDPGNWATNVAAGSAFNYNLLWVVVLGTAILILWQHMSAHLGIAKGVCLAEAVKQHMKPWAAAIYGTTAMAAIIATALAEILGSALGLYSLFHIPLVVGEVLVTVLIALALWFRRYHVMEKVVIVFVSLIGISYLVELYLVKPDWHAAAMHTFVPDLNSSSMLVAMGVLGAVVMPHNMYLHSEVIQNREWTGKSDAETRRLLRYEFLDTLVSMFAGMAINMAMIVVAAAVFFRHGTVVTDLLQASTTLEPLAGKLAKQVFAVGLVFAGVASTLTAGIAGGSTFSGYLKEDDGTEINYFRFGTVLTLGIACLILLFIRSTFKALVISQVCLSVQLPLTMLPLYLLTSSRRVMGHYVTGWLENAGMIVTGIIIVGLNILLLLGLLGVKF
ncbi:MAG TPA: Nramp family divalent metal transporter [Armatimonadota bacterium]|jgi:manganese transport protein